MFVRLTTLSLFSVLFLGMAMVVTLISPDAYATTWGPEQEISTDFLLQPQDSPSIAVDGDRVYLVWRDFGPDYDWNGDSEIYFRYYNGTSWQPIQEISNDVLSEPQHSPAIAAQNGKAHVVWVTGETTQNLHYRCFNGTVWQPEMRIYNATLPETQLHPSISVDGDNVHVVWENKGGSGIWEDIYYLYYDGSIWNPVQEISTDISDETQKYPSIAAENGEVHVVWNDYKYGDSDIFYRYYDGKRWDPEMEISTDVGNESQWGASIAIEGGRVYVVWTDNQDGDWDIFYRHFDGNSWQPQQEVSTDTQAEGQAFPSIAIDSGKVHVVWHEVRGNGNIKYRSYYGNVWTHEQLVNVGGRAWLQRGASIAADGDRFHVVWVNSADGYGDIYYRGGGEDLTAPESYAKPLSPYWKTTSTFNVDWVAIDDYDLANISLYYRYSSDNLSWSGWEEWSYDNGVSGTKATGSFLFAAPNGDGYYEFYTVAGDTSWNTETVPTPPDAIGGIDETPPTGSMVIDNGDGWATSNSVTLVLEYSDSTSGVHQVRYGNDGVWDTEPWELPSPTRVWTLTPGDGRKTVHYEIKDNAGLTATRSDDIDLDTAKPTGSIIINNYDAWTNSTSVTLTLTYTDMTSGVCLVRYSNDGIWDTELWESPSPTKAWTLTAGDGTKTVYYQIKDNTGLVSIGYSDDIGLDASGLTGSIVINDGDAWTSSPSVTVTMTYSDSASGVYQVRYSNDGVWDYEPWESPSPIKSWMLTPGDGTKTVYYQIKNNAGSESVTYSDEIGLDITPPKGSVVIDGGEERTNSTSVALTLTYSDNLSGVSQVRFSNDGVWDTEPWESPTATRAWTLTDGYGTKEVYFQVKDRAGLVSTTYVDYIEVGEPSEEPLGPPDGPIIDIPTVVTVITVCAITVAVFSIFEWLKYLFLTFSLPLYTKLKREKVMDHETRGMIRGYVIANPGDHFNAIKAALGLKNGTLAHHLRILEREDFVKSIRDGKYRRFFPVGAKVSEGAYPTKIEKLILDILEETPGRTQKEIARRLGVSQPAVSYHVRKLEKLNMIRSKKHRISLRYYVDNSP